MNQLIVQDVMEDGYRDWEAMLITGIRRIIDEILDSNIESGYVVFGKSGIGCMWDLWTPNNGSNGKEFFQINFDVNSDICTLADYRAVCNFFEAVTIEAEPQVIAIKNWLK